jgi:dienelactone hydrolase
MRALGEYSYVSRGDRVSARRWLPNGTAPFPWVLLVHDAGDSKDLDVGAAVQGFGLAFAGIDLALHGDRANAKLSKPLMADLQAGRAGGLTAEFVRQSFADLAGAIETLSDAGGGDPRRLGLAGFGTGAALAAAFAVAEPRVLALAMIDARALPDAMGDLADAEGALSPRPVLRVDGESAREAAWRFFADQLGGATTGS